MNEGQASQPSNKRRHTVNCMLILQSPLYGVEDQDDRDGFFGSNQARPLDPIATNPTGYVLLVELGLERKVTS